MGRLDQSRMSALLVLGAATLAVGLSVLAVHQSGARTPDAAAPIGFAMADPTTSSAAPSTPPTASAQPSVRAGVSATATAPARPTSVTYVVKPGDTLTAIAQWFELHGFRSLYESNQSVIGADPDLIYPGQTITLSANGVRVGR